MDTDVLKQLVNSTYTPLFGEGLRNLTAMVRSHVTRELSDWLVCDTNIMVEYSQLTDKLSKIRKSCEASFPLLLASMCLLPPSERETPELNDDGNGGGGGKASAAAGVESGSFSMVATLLAQTWDVVDSPLFSNVCTEAIDTCFRHVNTKLRDKVFLPSDMQDAAAAVAGEGSDSSSSGIVMSTPPLASLLPQLKAIARDMLPAAPVPGAAPNSKAVSSSSALLTQEVRDIASGAALDTLCVAIFDAPGA